MELETNKKNNLRPIKFSDPENLIRVYLPKNKHLKK